MEVLVFVVGAIVGIILTFIIARIIIRRWHIGVLHIVQTHLEVDPQLLLDLDHPIDYFIKKKYALVKIDRISTRK